MAAKKKGPGKGRGPATRPPSPAKRTTVPKPATAKPPPGKDQAAGKPRPSAPSAPPSQSAKATAKAKATPTTPGNNAPQSPPAKTAPTTKAAAASGKPAKAAPPSAKTAPTSGGAGPTRSAAGKTSAAPAAAAAPSAKGRPRGGPTREERLAAAEAERKRRSIRNKVLLAVGVVAVMFVVSFVLVSDKKERDQQAAQFQTGSCTFDRKSDKLDAPPRNHVPNPTYKVDPPAGGSHTPQAAAPGIYTDANTPIDGQIVHAMEHGYVVLWYRPDLDEQSLNLLRDLAQKHQSTVLMVPRPPLDTPVAATAWHARLLCGGFDGATIERFVTTFLNQGPEKGFITNTGAGQ